MQILSDISDRTAEYVNHKVDVQNLDFTAAKGIAKAIAAKRAPNSMILSWKNGITGDFYPKYECGGENRPVWIHYAESRGANLTVDINDGQYIFMILTL